MILLLDGTDITAKIASAKIIADRDAPHNQIEIASATPELFASVDPRTNPGTHRITLNHAGETWYFLLEPPVRGDERNFTFGGRSLSAQLEELYAGKTSLSLIGYSEAEREAGDVCSIFAGDRGITWNLGSVGPLPETWSFSGSPIDGIREIAGIFGGIVRCSPEGDILVEPYYKVDPRSVSSADFSVDSDADVVDSVGYEEVDGLKYNAVIIRSPAEYENPDIEIEGDEHLQWNPAYVRVFWDRPDVKINPDTFSTSGILSKSNPFIVTSQYTEDVEFRDGVGSVNHAMQSLVSCVWYGVDGGTPDWAVGGTELRISGVGGLATVTYTATYQRWKLSGMSQETVLAGFGDPLDNAVAWDFILTGTETVNRMEDIEDTNIRTLAGGTARAKAELFATADKRFLDIETDAGSRHIMDGMTIDLIELKPLEGGGYEIIPAEIMGIYGPFFVQKSELKFESVKELYQLRIEKWLL